MTLCEPWVPFPPTFWLVLFLAAGNSLTCKCCSILSSFSRAVLCRSLKVRMTFVKTELARMKIGVLYL